MFHDVFVRGRSVIAVLVAFGAALGACEQSPTSGGSAGTQPPDGGEQSSPLTSATMGDAQAANGGVQLPMDVTPIESYEAYCAAAAELYCATLDECCAAANVPYQREVCDRNAFAYASVPVAWCGLGFTPAMFDGTAAAQCLALRAQHFPDCAFLRADDPLAVAAAHVCDRVAVFERDPNASCDQTPCFSPPGTVSGCNVVFDAPGPYQCTPPTPRAPLGGSCAGWSHPCDFGLFCDYGVCVTPRPDGADCTQDDECSSQKCTDPFIGPFPRVCEPVRTLGWDECTLFTEPRASGPPLREFDSPDLSTLPACEARPKIAGACASKIEGTGDFGNDGRPLVGTIIGMGAAEERPDCFGSDNWGRAIPNATPAGQDPVVPEGTHWWRVDDGEGNLWTVAAAAPGLADLGISVGDRLTFHHGVSFGGYFFHDGNAEIDVEGRGRILFAINRSSDLRVVGEGPAACADLGACPGYEWAMRVEIDGQEVVVPPATSVMLGDAVLTNARAFTHGPGYDQNAPLAPCDGFRIDFVATLVTPQ